MDMGMGLELTVYRTTVHVRLTPARGVVVRLVQGCT